MYVSKREFGGECLEMAVEPEHNLAEFGIGKQVEVVARGTVKSVRAPYKGYDYDKPWNYEDEKKGKTRPVKTHPGRIEIDLEGKPSIQATTKPSGIVDLTAMMDADDLPGD